MPSEPLILIFRSEDFDLSQLPISADLLNANPAMRDEAIADYYARLFKGLGGEARITASKGVITVQWNADSDTEGAIARAVEMLGRGNYQVGVSILRGLLPKSPEHPAILYNLGMALSDLGQLQDALRLLKKLTEIQPDNPRAFIALGVALARAGDADGATQALEKALTLDPEDGYAHRNLAGLLVRTDQGRALPHFKRAAELLPQDQAAQLGYGQALTMAGREDDADGYLRACIDLDPLSPLAERARTARTQIAHKTLRTNAGGDVRMDAVFYCLAALRLFRQKPELVQSATFEIAMLGRRGLDINDPKQKYTLKSLEGEFSGLQLVSYMYVGLKKLAPDQDAGIDLSREYQQAQSLMGAD